MANVEVVAAEVTPAAAMPLSGPTAVGVTTVFNGPARFMGFTVLGGAAAGIFTVHDGQDDTGQIVGDWEVAASSCLPTWYGPGGIILRAGLTVHVSAALSRLVLYVIPAWRPGLR